MKVWSSTSRLKANKRYYINQENWFITINNCDKHLKRTPQADKRYNTDQTLVAHLKAKKRFLRNITLIKLFASHVYSLSLQEQG